MSDSSLTFTPQQIAALETPDVSIALSAGAGCGKTFVLTQRFLKHLETSPSDDPLAGIVAITFTDRAAREMRDRIRSACHERLQSAQGDLAVNWLKILRAIDTARITTIHSFCASILRSHAVDARLDPRFGLLEESLGDTLLRRTVTDAVHRLLTAHDEDCMELVLQYGLERTIDFLRQLVMDRFQADPSRFAEITADQLADQWLDRWRNQCIPLLLKTLAKSEAARKLAELLTAYDPDHPEMNRRWEILRQTLHTFADSENPEEALAAIREVAKIQGGGGKKVWDNEDVYNDVKDALTAFRKALDKVLKDMQFDDADVDTAVRLAMMMKNVIDSAVADYERNKAEVGMLDFDDLLMKTRDLLRDSDSVSRRAAAGIDFLMVDEFQDTDPVQSEIVRRLCGDRLLNGKLFLVGDAKQSIYRFRRADPRVFDSLRAEIPEAGRLPLSVNFRSQPEVLKFVNRLFGPAMGDDYEPLVPHVEQLSPTPTVEFLFSREEADDHRETAAERRRREADWIAARIANLLSDPEPGIRERDPETGEMRLRTVQPGDVTVLFRTLSNVALYEDALRQRGIDYYLVGGRAFFAQQEIADVVNLFATLNDPDDAVALAGLLRSPFFNLTDETLYAMVTTASTLHDALRAAEIPLASREQQSQIRFAAEILDELRAKKDRIGLAALLQTAVDRTGYDAALLNEHLGRRKLANLDKLVDMARQYDRSGMMSLAEFVERIQDSIAEETNEELAVTHPESSDVVRLMTVHQSKGLEFPVVVVADMDWMRRGGSRGAVFHPELGPLLPMPTKRGVTPKNLGQTIHRIEEQPEEEAETVRVLYVATTRAADRLILSAGLKADGQPSSPWMKLLAERFDLQTGLPKADPYFGSVAGVAVDPADVPEIQVHQRIPETASPQGTAARKTTLSQFRELVETADASPLPETLAPLPPRVGNRVQLSVSQILRADLPTGSFATNDDTDSAERFDSPDARMLGNLVHAAIERLALKEERPVVELIDRAAASLTGAVGDSLKEHAVRRIEAFVDSSVYDEMASAQNCYRELDFLLRRPSPTRPSQQIVISGQIDCLIQSVDNRWRIIDFKTGRQHGPQPKSIVDEYAIQLALYAFAVEQLIGRPPDDIEITVIRDEIQRFPFAFDETVRTNFAGRIDAAILELSGHAAG